MATAAAIVLLPVASAWLGDAMAFCISLVVAVAMLIVGERIRVRPRAHGRGRGAGAGRLVQGRLAARRSRVTAVLAQVRRPPTLPIVAELSTGGYPPVETFGLWLLMA